MAIRLRIVDEKWIAVCAACTVEKEGDVYLDDGQHGALADKFSRDFNDMFGGDLPHDPSCAILAELEESEALKQAASGATKPDVEVRRLLNTAIN
jgi:hypothetical protein